MSKIELLPKIAALHEKSRGVRHPPPLGGRVFCVIFPKGPAGAGFDVSRRHAAAIDAFFNTKRESDSGRIGAFVVK